jgi:hypothetical protein
MGKVEPTAVVAVNKKAACVSEVRFETGGFQSYSHSPLDLSLGWVLTVSD